jgi:hypothetical protein
LLPLALQVPFLPFDCAPAQRQYRAVIGQTYNQCPAFWPGLGAINDQIGRFIAQTGLHRPHKWFKQGIDNHLLISHKTLKASDLVEQLNFPGAPQRHHLQLHMATEEQAGHHQCQCAQMGIVFFVQGCQQVFNVLKLGMVVYSVW